MSLWSKIKAIWEASGEIDNNNIIDDIKGNAGKIEATAKNLKPGEDFVVIDPLKKSGFVPKVNSNADKARKAAEAKAKNRETPSKVLGKA